MVYWLGSEEIMYFSLFLRVWPEEWSLKVLVVENSEGEVVIFSNSSMLRSHLRRSSGE